MKKTILQVLVITLLMSFTGCMIESGDDIDGNVTEKGLELCHYWDNTLNAGVLAKVEKAFNLNAYLTASEAGKTLIEDLYFSDYKIRQIDSTQWSLIEQQTTRYRFNTNGKSLSEIGAKWIVISYYNAYYGTEPTSINSYTIECTGASIWKITTTDSDPFYVDYTLTTDTLIETLTSASYTLEGSSFLYYSTYYDCPDCYNPETNAEIYIDATITEPIHKTPQGYSSGKINLTATNNANQEIETTAEFYRQNPVTYKVRITYKGVTESWSY